MSEFVQIALRIPVEQFDFIKEMDAKQIDIWRIGFEKWAMEYPEYLQKKAQEYKDMYSKYIAKQQKCYTNAIQKRNFLDELYELYVSTGRDIGKPSAEDRSWVKGRLDKTHNGVRYSSEQFFDYCRKRFEDDKQKRLEVIE